MSAPSPVPGRRDRRATARRLLLLPAYAVLAVVLAAPVLVQSTLAGLRFDDRLATVPVEVGVVRNGYSVVDTGVLGSAYLERTGVLGLGLSLRVTGPPDAGGSLASYVDPRFVRVNTATLSDPHRVAGAYADRLTGQFLGALWPRALLAGLLGGALLLGAAHPALGRLAGRRRVMVAIGGGLGLLLASISVATWQHVTWEGTDVPDELYPLPQQPGLSLSSPQIRELAEQVRPFIEKNVDRLTIRARTYQERAEASVPAAVTAAAGELRPRDGEVVVVAEGDPQGSEVGTAVRTVLYDELREALGDEALVARTISGDVTSNGTVAEKQFVEEEVAASDAVPVVAVKGDHDSEATVEQLEGAGAVVPDLEVEDIGGLRFAGVADPDFKSLFGGRVTNPSGVPAGERGAQLRTAVTEATSDAVHALVHQDDAALGYLGLDLAAGSEVLTEDEPDASSWTTPREDGVPDVPAGSITYGHLHESAGPWVVWNTDGDEVTWTLVDQVGTSGGVEEAPTFDRFSTPYSPPLKPIELRLHYVDAESGLVTGFVSLRLSTRGDLVVSRRTDVGVPRSR